MADMLASGLLPQGAKLYGLTVIDDNDLCLKVQASEASNIWRFAVPWKQGDKGLP